MKRFLVLALALSLLAFAPTYAFAVANGTRGQTQAEAGAAMQTQAGAVTQDQTQDCTQTQDQMQDQTQDRTQDRTQTQDRTAACDEDPVGAQSMYQRSFKYAYAAENEGTGQYREQAQDSNTGEDSQAKTEYSAENGESGDEQDSLQAKFKRFFGDLLDTLTSFWRG